MRDRLNRRSFLGIAASAAAAGSPAPATLPAIRLGKHNVTRLVAGDNPIGGYGHFVPKLNAIVKDWFTPQRTLELIERCEAAGIDTWQASVDPKAFGGLRAAWDRGSMMQWMCLTGGLDSQRWKT